MREFDFHIEVRPPSPPRPSYKLNVVLFAATVLSTLAAGAIQKGYNPFTHPASLREGVPFSFTLILVLLTHELGHYFVSRIRGVEVSLPYFIPAPSFIGTFGAFIRMRSLVRNKQVLLEVGAAGPLCGLVAAIPVTMAGLRWSTLVPTEGGPKGLMLGSSLLFNLLTRLVVGEIPPGYDVLLHPVAFAGWIGLLVTALNLIPVGQLDGGHIAYALLGPYYGTVGRFTLIALVVLGFIGWPGWYVWAALVYFLGRRHPRPLDPYTPLDARRRMLGALCGAVLALTFTPFPFKGF